MATIWEESRIDFEYTQAVEILRRTPATLTLLRGLPEVWITSAEGPDTWSAYDIVGHLLHGEKSDWIERAHVILEHGETQPFDTFSRTTMFEKYQGSSSTSCCRRSSRRARRIWRRWTGSASPPEKLALKGIHPALGTVTLSQRLATWVVHYLNHIGQIVEVMSRQYAEAVGPWRACLAILTRPILTE